LVQLWGGRPLFRGNREDRDMCLMGIGSPHKVYLGSAIRVKKEELERWVI